MHTFHVKQPHFHPTFTMAKWRLKFVHEIRQSVRVQKYLYLVNASAPGGFAWRLFSTVRYLTRATPTPHSMSPDELRTRASSRG